MPANFQTQPPAEVWSTLAQVSRTVGSGQNLHFIGRLTRGLSLAAADAALAPTTAVFREQFKAQLPRDVRIELFPQRQLIVSDLRTPVRILFGAISLVLLIACANVASLILGRTAERGRELAVRVAVGATRSRLARQLLTESLLLAAAGGALGLVLARWGLDLLLASLPRDLAVAEIALDWWAVAFTFGVSVATGVAFGLVPAWSTVRSDLHDALKQGSGRTTAAARQGRVRNAIVVAEIALSLVLLVGAGLLIRTMANLLHTDPGFDPRRLLAAEIWVNGSGNDSTAQIAGFYDRLTASLEATPGVQAAAVVESGLPLEWGGNLPVAVDGRYLEETIDYRTVTPGFFRAVGIPLLRGRALATSDAAGGAPVVVVNETFARRFLAGGPALGRPVTVGGRNDANAPRVVVGIVGDVKSLLTIPARPTVFIPSAQTPAALTRIFNGWFPIHVVVRVKGDPASLVGLVERTIHQTDPRVPVGRVRPVVAIEAESVAFRRFVMLLLTAFAALALALATVGVYGVMAYLVTQRRHEIGVRIALGALPREVLGLVIGRGMLLVLAGAGLGLAGAAALTRLLASQLYGVRPADPVTFALVTVALALVALVACVVPARRATRVDPVVALRAE
jgi:predicted permease